MDKVEERSLPFDPQTTVMPTSEGTTWNEGRAVGHSILLVDHDFLDKAE